jgi:hypothetical protein
MTHRYLLPITAGPLFYTRVPATGVLWKDIIKAMTPIMKSYGLRQKDIYSVEGYDPAKDAKLIEHLGKAYAEPNDFSRVKDFDLWDWKVDKFVKVREVARG